MYKFNLLKYLSKWKYLIFAVCVLGALIVYKYAMYNQEYTASTVISYTGQNAADSKKKIFPFTKIFKQIKFIHICRPPFV